MMTMMVMTGIKNMNILHFVMAYVLAAPEYNGQRPLLRGD